MSFTISGLNHIGLVVKDIKIAKDWFHGSLGLKILEDRGEIIFLLAGRDIIAIKTPQMAIAKPEHGCEPKDLSGSFAGWQTLDHYGFYAKDRDEVDQFANFLQQEENQATIVKGPYDRSDGRSVYFRDPCGLVGEYLWLSSNLG